MTFSSIASGLQNIVNKLYPQEYIEGTISFQCPSQRFPYTDDFPSNQSSLFSPPTITSFVLKRPYLFSEGIYELARPYLEKVTDSCSKNPPCLSALNWGIRPLRSSLRFLLLKTSGLVASTLSLGGVACGKKLERIVQWACEDTLQEDAFRALAFSVALIGTSSFIAVRNGIECVKDIRNRNVRLLLHRMATCGLFTLIALREIASLQGRIVQEEAFAKEYAAALKGCKRIESKIEDFF